MALRFLTALLLAAGNLQIILGDGNTQPPPAVAMGVLRIEDPGGIASQSVLLRSEKKGRVSRQAQVDAAEGDPNNLFSNADVPRLTGIQADCVNPQFIKVSVDFDRPFEGIMYTKGHFNDDTCSFAKDEVRTAKYNFTIPTDLCGSLDNKAEAANSSVTEATIIIQNDPLFQDVNDVARRIRCAWSDRFDKVISSRGFKVGPLGENTMDYSADAVSVWMDLRMGKDPFQGSPVANGVVRLGSDMTIVVYIKSKIDKGLDVVIRDCVANDAKKHQQIQLTDENGCVMQKKLMTPFTITDRVGQSGASRIAYAMLKSFKFPDSLDVNIICNVAMCKGPCGISCNTEKPVAGVAKPTDGKKQQAAAIQKVDSSVPVARPKRQSQEPGPMDGSLLGKTVFLREKEPMEVVLERGIRVLSDNDITEVLVGNQNNKTYDIMATMVKNNDYICIPKTGFAIGLAILLLIILILTILTVFLCCAACARRRTKEKVVGTSTINLYNSSEQLNSRSKHSVPTILSTSPPNSLMRGSMPNISMDTRGSDFLIPRVSQEPNFKASAITLPGLGIHTNPNVRHSTLSLNAMHYLPTDKPFLPIMLPPPASTQGADKDMEKVRSLRSITVRNRPHSFAAALDPQEEDHNGETSRSLRSFSVRSKGPTVDAEENGENARSMRSFSVRSKGPAVDADDNDENARSLRSFTLRSNRSVGQDTVTEGNVGTNDRSMRSFTVRSHGSAASENSDNGENPRSEGTLRSGSAASLVHSSDHEAEENPRSMRSVSVYRT